MKHAQFPYVPMLLAFLAACGPPAADRSPLQFVAYEKNPILGTGIKGDWDTLNANTPDVVFVKVINVLCVMITGADMKILA